jgi:hypothetical protein
VRWIATFLGLAAAAHAATIPYQASDEDIPNPERGLSVTFIGPVPSVADMRELRVSRHITLGRRIFALDRFRETPISEAALASFEQDFAAARQAGLKLVPRFAYNFDAAGPDASLSRIEGQLDQLAPLLRRNGDVTAFVQAGFIGRWGEWHDSSNDLDNTAARSAILKKLLSVLPGGLMAAVRYPEQKREIFNTRSNLSASEAFDGSDMSRVGFHDDCFLASDDDWGTFTRESPDTLQGQKAYLGRETRYVVMGGETCNLCARAADCRTALGELEKFHYSELNSEYEPHVLKKWEEGGCMPEARRRLGYRFKLVDAEIPSEIQRGGRLAMKINLSNEGFAPPYNPRPVWLVLRGAKSRQETVIPLKEDPRRWMPGERQSLDIDWQVPSSLAEDSYYLFLRFPDPAPSLKGRPEYCIRLANQGLWEQATGNNWLKASVTLK